jgi:hypothetical protein
MAFAARAVRSGSGSTATVGAVEYDFDEDFAQTLGAGLDRALEKLTPEQRAKLPEMENLPPGSGWLP